MSALSRPVRERVSPDETEMRRHPTSHIRNVSIIAHVDHGKTTLCDSLLFKSGYLARDKQGRALAMDTDEEEKRRGITIKSTAVSLDFPLERSQWEEAARHQGIRMRTIGSKALARQSLSDGSGESETDSSTPSSTPDVPPVDTLTPDVPPTTDDRLSSCLLYIGNLPFNMTEKDQDLLSKVLESLPLPQVRTLSVNVRHAWAFAELSEPISPDTAARVSADPQAELHGRRLVVELQGQSPELLLREKCKELSLPPPAFRAIEGERTKVAVEIGGETCFAEAESFKQGKRLAAAIALKALDRDGATDSSSPVVDLEVSQKETEDEEGDGMTNSMRDLRLNLVDCPGHADFSSEVTAALRLCDGAVVVVDSVEGVCVQTETVLRQALRERVRVILMLNKFDRVILELQLSPEDAAQALMRSVEQVNSVIESCQDPKMPDQRVSWRDGSVILGAGLQGWALSLPGFASLYPESKRSKVQTALGLTGGEGESNRDWLPKSFKKALAQLVLEPVTDLCKLAAAGEIEAVDAKLSKLGRPLPSKVKNAEGMTGKVLIRAAMQQLIPAADCLLEAIAVHLPSPREALTYRAPILFPEGPAQSEAERESFKAVQQCSQDPTGPLVLYVSKMVPMPGSNSRCYAFGRVFAGRVCGGQQVVVTESVDGVSMPNQEKIKSIEGRVQGVVQFLGLKAHSVGAAAAGELVALVGLDSALKGKAATVKSKHVEETAGDGVGKWTGALRGMSYEVHAVMQRAVRCVRPEDQARLMAAVRLLCKTDGVVQSWVDPDSKESIVASCGALHLEVCIGKLKEYTGTSVQLEVSAPKVSYRECVIAESPAPCLTKSANKKVRLFVSADPLDPRLVEDIEAGRFSVDQRQDPAAWARALAQYPGWEGGSQGPARRVLCWGPDESGPNCLVDATVGINIQAIRDHLVGAFQSVTARGPLAREKLRGVRFRLVDAVIHSDSAHTGPAQVVPAMERALQAALLSAEPSLVEPLYEVEVVCPSDCGGSVYRLLTSSRGRIVSEERSGWSDVHQKVSVTALVPVSEGSGFTSSLAQATGGRASAQTKFGGWIPQEPELGRTTVSDLRLSKGMKVEVPKVSDLTDRL
uniref:Elongation factor 2 n=1 Tax=Chromera velia CCMP2878 TaxID=1169474 RepID=A0A0G4HD83_9ALVE|eukprot:Cvel_26461.t1-p1 / transcript=Cvel_26461.t1 / gene=Cvel_26461 / organism=Chromera_velia_CCMP2878 / gene_product=Elongation factor 2, putative / transcript_product=Elongation factor 2, putative / location=Cvel_scaffold3147:13630-18853(-) / protein_length=1100 / sequence_SO=supercontig / SO=protein_coding / is_pseudo=false